VEHKLNETSSTASKAPSIGKAVCDYVQIDGDSGAHVRGGVIDEARVCLSVNGREWVTIMCSPFGLEQLALGFMLNEGLVASVAEVRSIKPDQSGTCLDIWLSHAVELPQRLTVTAGCGGGATFDAFSTTRAPLTSTRGISADQIHALMRALNGAAALYRDVRGVHTSALSDGESLLCVAQDIGRHNTIDRLRGHAAQTGLDTRDLILLASGRISSEMLSKAAVMGVPIVISRTSPTRMSLRLAEAWGITVIGYARGGHCRVYTGAARVAYRSRASADD
jgi:FdhD protein